MSKKVAKAEEVKAEEVKAEEVKVTRRAKKAIRATNGTVSVKGKMIVTSDAVELDSAALKDRQFMKHVEYGVECGILEWVK